MDSVGSNDMQQSDMNHHTHTLQQDGPRRAAGTIYGKKEKTATRVDGRTVGGDSHRRINIDLTFIFKHQIQSETRNANRSLCATSQAMLNIQTKDNYLWISPILSLRFPLVRRLRGEIVKSLRPLAFCGLPAADRS